MSQQIADIQQFVSQKVSAILLTTSNSTGIIPP